MLSRRRFLGASAAPLLQSQTVRRPNIVFVLVDDLRWDELGCTGHPFAQTPNADRLAREGANFSSAFAVTPLCSPSRASFLTGKYPHQHGITDNTDRSAQSHRLLTWPRQLHDAGYDTAFIGKWHMGNDDSPRPGFNHWVSFPGQGESTNPTLNVNGRAQQTRGYITDLLSDHAIQFIKQQREKPLCLWLAHKAIHPNVQQRNDGSISSFGTAEEFIVADRHRNLYASNPIPHRPNYAKPASGKPALQRSLAGLTPLGPTTATDDATIRNRMRMTKAIDEGLGEMLKALESNGQLDNTAIVFTSDHGYFYGEHGLNYERRLAYEETIRIPLLIRYPAAYRPRTRVDDFTLSLDISTLALNWAGVRKAQAPKRKAFLIEYFSDRVFPRTQNMGYQAVRTRRWKYIHYTELKDSDEVYDLEADPYEMTNLFNDRRAPVRDLQAELQRLLNETRA
ncbi:MAG: sulfatase-like hydrolase/transferase [Bryobacterales bacterium]|nr:sulfatase-like hydrolase/transferase [Bryobacterales bacterium]